MDDNWASCLMDGLRGSEACRKSTPTLYADRSRYPNARGHEPGHSPDTKPIERRLEAGVDVLSADGVQRPDRNLYQLIERLCLWVALCLHR